jgi:hypothetical protein
LARSSFGFSGSRGIDEKIFYGETAAKAGDVCEFDVTVIIHHTRKRACQYATVSVATLREIKCIDCCSITVSADEDQEGQKCGGWQNRQETKLCHEAP